MGLLGSLLPEPLQRVNALKNLLALVANTRCGRRLHDRRLGPDQLGRGACCSPLGATLGGVIGARVGRRLPPAVLRVVIVVVGLAAIVKLLA